MIEGPAKTPAPHVSGTPVTACPRSGSVEDETKPADVSDCRGRLRWRYWALSHAQGFLAAAGHAEAVKLERLANRACMRRSADEYLPIGPVSRGRLHEPIMVFISPSSVPRPQRAPTTPPSLLSPPTGGRWATAYCWFAGLIGASRPAGTASLCLEAVRDSCFGERGLRARDGAAAAGHTHLRESTFDASAATQTVMLCSTAWSFRRTDRGHGPRCPEPKRLSTSTSPTRAPTSTRRITLTMAVETAPNAKPNPSRLLKPGRECPEPRNTITFVHHGRASSRNSNPLNHRVISRTATRSSATGACLEALPTGNCRRGRAGPMLSTRSTGDPGIGLDVRVPARRLGSRPAHSFRSESPKEDFDEHVWHLRAAARPTSMTAAAVVLQAFAV